MPNRVLQRLALILAIVMMTVWGGVLIVDPHLISGYFSIEPVNQAFAGMMGAALLGLAFISLAGVTRWMQTPRALGVAMAILVVETAYLMLGSGDMLVTLPTTISLVTAAAVAFFLLI
jgi:predicted small integral membrane protein